MDRFLSLERARNLELRTANRLHEEMSDGNGLSFDTLEAWVDAKIALALAVEGEDQG